MYDMIHIIWSMSYVKLYTKYSLLYWKKSQFFLLKAYFVHSSTSNFDGHPGGSPTLRTPL